MNPFQQAYNFFTGKQQYASPIPQNQIVPASQPLTPKQIYDQKFTQQVKAKGGYVDAQGNAHFDDRQNTNMNVPQLVQKAVQTVLPAPQAANAQQANTSIQPNITIPYSQGGKYTLPAPLAQTLMNSFDKTHEATHAAQVLNHPADDPYLPGDPTIIDHNTYGENGSFKTVKDTTNDDGSIDRGLFRINSGTFAGYMSNPQSKATLAKMGITKYEDMNDPQKNANFASLLQQNSGWGRWFAAPKDLRAGASTGQVVTMHPKKD